MLLYLNMEQQKLSVEQQKDVETRIEGFRSAYLELTKKFEVELVAFPQYAPMNGGGFGTVTNIIIADKKYAPVPSPMQKDSIIKKQ